MATLILGASGLLGRSLYAEMSENGVAGTYFSRPGAGLKYLDVRDPRSITELVRTLRPGQIVNAIGERRPNVWENDPSAMVTLNVDAAACIADAARLVDAKLIHVSSDYVFDGGDPPYGPDDPTRPVNGYGQSKVAAEHEVRMRCPQATILRIPVLYGPTVGYRESNVTEIAHNVGSGVPIELDHTTLRYPTHVDDVAKICKALLGAAIGGCTISGTWHFGSSVGYTKYEIACLVGQVHGLSMDHIRPAYVSQGDRPGDCRLDSSALLELLGETAVGGRSFTSRLRSVTRPWIAGSSH